MKIFMKYLLWIAVIAVTGCSVSPDAERFSQQEPTAERLAPTNSLNPALEDSWDEHGIQRMIHALKYSALLQEEAMELGYLLITLETTYPWESTRNSEKRHAKDGKEDPLGKLLAATISKYYPTDTHQGLLDIIHNRALFKELLDYFTQEPILSETERAVLTEAIEKHDLAVIETQIGALYGSFMQHFIRVYHRDGIGQTDMEKTSPVDYDDSDMNMLTEADSPTRKAVIRLITTLIQKYYDIPEAEKAAENISQKSEEKTAEKAPEASPKASETAQSDPADQQAGESIPSETGLPVGTYIAKNIAHKAADTGKVEFTYDLEFTIEKQSPSQYTLKAWRMVRHIGDTEEKLTFAGSDTNPLLIAFDPETKKLYFVLGAADGSGPLLLHFEGVLHQTEERTIIEGKFTITGEDQMIQSQSSWTAELGAAPGPDKKTETEPAQSPAEEETPEKAAEEADAPESKQKPIEPEKTPEKAVNTPDPKAPEAPVAEENESHTSTDSGKKTAHPKTELPVGTYIAKNVEHRVANTGELEFAYELQLRITQQSDNGTPAPFINFLKLIINQNGKERVITFPDEFGSKQALIPIDPETKKINFTLGIPVSGNRTVLFHFEGQPRFNRDKTAVIEGRLTVKAKDGTILSQSSWTAELEADKKAEAKPAQSSAAKEEEIPTGWELY